MKTIFLSIGSLSLLSGIYSLFFGPQGFADNMIFGISGIIFGAIFLRGYWQLKVNGELES